MAPIIPPDDLQQAWQTAFQLRTCPDDAVLRATSPDENLNRHLAACSICREKRAMPVEQVKAWHNLFSKFAPLVHQAVNTSQPGQVWVLKKKLSRWGYDGYYYSPPNVLLLEKLDDKHGYRAAQLYFDKCLMGEGDVWLGEKFGFAQGWNSYTIHQNALECWLGNATDSQLTEVINARTMKYAPVEEYSILSFFRKLEITVGSYVAVPSVVELVKELEAAPTEAIELIPGLKLAVTGAKDFVLDIASGTLDLLRGTFKPAMVLRGGTTKPAAAKLSDEQTKLVQEHCSVIPIDMKVAGDTLTVTLNWLQEKTAELPAIKVVVNGNELSDAVIVCEGSDKITITSAQFNMLTSQQITSLVFSCTENTLILQIIAGSK